MENHVQMLGYHEYGQPEDGLDSIIIIDTVPDTIQII
jgi:hypothetical protein